MAPCAKSGATYGTENVEETIDGIDLATRAGLLEDVQGYEAAMPAEQIVQALLRPQCLQVLPN